MLKKRPVIWWILLACAIICSAVLVVGRFSAEQHSQKVCAAIQLDDLQLLADGSGLSADEWRTRLEKVGVCYFVEDLYDLPALPMIESISRTRLALPDGVDINTYDGDTVKTLYFYHKYGVRVDGSDAQSIEDLLFRGVMDRGLRLLVITPFYNTDGERVYDIEVYEQCLSDLAERLEARGIDYGDGFSVFTSPEPSPWLILGAGIAPALAGAWLVSRVLNRRRWETAIALIAVAGLAALTVWNAFLAQKLMMFGSAVLFPCVFAVLVSRFIRREPPRLAARPVAVCALEAILLTVTCGLVGGLSVSALMSTREYMAGGVMFTGVKLALMAPLGFAALLLVIELVQEKLPRGKFIRTGLICAVILAVAGVVMVLRSGDVSSNAPGMDKVLAVRNWFEYNFFVRPRTKEMLVAVPCIPVFVWACRRSIPWLRLLGGMGVCLECVSVVNTFCHAVAPLSVSLIRTLLAVAIGLVLGFIAVAILDLLHRLLKAN